MGKMYIYEPCQTGIVYDVTKHPRFTVMRMLTGSHLEVLNINNNDAWMVIDGEGILKGLPYNKAATEVYFKDLVKAKSIKLPIVGTAVLFEGVKISYIMECMIKINNIPMGWKLFFAIAPLFFVIFSFFI